ncbi:MAG: nucleoside deaminase [Kiritimatiellia bacterium]
MARPLQPDFARFDAQFMRMALREAEKAASDGEVPLGCVIVQPAVLEPAHDGHAAILDPDPLAAKILGRAHNQTEGLSDATAHAEMLAMSSAFAAKGDWRLAGARLYVTKEPCPMCAGGIVLARLDTVLWGVSDPKRGGGTVFGIFDHPGINHHPRIVTGVLEAESLALLQDFFRARRESRQDAPAFASRDQTSGWI